MSARPMTAAQRAVLRELAAADGRFDGYCEIMLQTGLKSYKAVDWVLDALERRGYIVPNGHGDGYELTDAGRSAADAMRARGGQ